MKKIRSSTSPSSIRVVGVIAGVVIFGFVFVFAAIFGFSLLSNRDIAGPDADQGRASDPGLLGDPGNNEEPESAIVSVPDDETVTAESSGDPELDRAFSQARDEFNRGRSRSRRFENALRSVAARLHEVPVAVGDEPLNWDMWRALDTGSRQYRFSAFRFRSPLDVPADMHWVFAAPSSGGFNWYILPVDGTMTGFRNYHELQNLSIDGVELPPSNEIVFQELQYGQIQPGAEYIVWFALPRRTAEEIPLAIRLSPAESDVETHDALAIADLLNIEIKYPEYDPTPEGIALAFSEAASLYNESGLSGPVYSAVSSVAPALPLINVAGEEEEVIWNHVTPDVSFRFNAVRIRSPLSVPADLHWAFTNDESDFSWSIISDDRQHAPVDDSSMALSVELPDIGTSDLILQSIHGGFFEPDRDYVIIFGANDSALPDMDLALRFTPAGDHPFDSNASAIADLIGIDVPEVPTVTQQDAVRERCRSWVDHGGTDGIILRRLLEWVRPALPEIVIGSERPEWNELQLEGSPSGFYAFRLTAPTDDPAGLSFALAKGVEVLTHWNVVPVGGAASMTGNRFSEHDTQPPGGPQLPDKNVVVFEWINDHQDMMNRESIIWFAPVDREPLTVHLAARFHTEPPDTRLASSRAVAAFLGIELPAVTTLPGSRTLLGHSDTVTAIELTRDEELIYSGSRDGTVRVWNRSDGSLQKTIDAPYSVIDIAVSDDGRRLAATLLRRESNVVIWNLENLDDVLLLHCETPALDVAFSPDGALLATCGSGHQNYVQTDPSTLDVWDCETGDRVVSIPTNGAVIDDVGFSTDGDRLIAAGGQYFRRDAMIGVFVSFDCENFEVVSSSSDEHGWWNSFAITADGRRMFVTKNNYRISSWESDSPQPTSTVVTDIIPQGIDISADGSIGVTGASDGTLQLWELDPVRLRSKWHAHQEIVGDVAISSDGNTIVSGGADGAVRIWETEYQLSQGLSAADFQLVTNSLDMTLAPIPAGQFQMGSSDTYELTPGYIRDIENERPQHVVNITRPFYMAAHEVTVGQFRQFVDDTGYVTTAERSGTGGAHMFDSSAGLVQRAELTWRQPGYKQESEFPVVQVSWLDAIEFCRWLSEKEGSTYRLPTEAEWEYACRGGTSSSWIFGENTDAGMMRFVGNVADLSIRRQYESYGVAETYDDGFAYSAPVGSFLPNAYGLHDMHGNVWEWCSDLYGPIYYQFTAVDDPPGPESGNNRVQRGASFFHHVCDARSANRDYGPEDQAQSHLGFRVVREFDD